MAPKAQASAKAKPKGRPKAAPKPKVFRFTISGWYLRPVLLSLWLVPNTAVCYRCLQLSIVPSLMLFMGPCYVVSSPVILLPTCFTKSSFVAASMLLRISLHFVP